jgi:hypothetical protein
MLLLDRDSVEIKIVEPAADTDSSELELLYHDRAYRLVQAFSQSRIQRVRQLLQQLKPAQIERYLVVRERNFYSLWSLAIGSKLAELEEDRALLSMQASCWFLQEMWLQLEDLLGKKQTQQFSEKLLASTPQIRSKSDFDRLLAIEPLKVQSDPVWMQRDLIDLIHQFEQLIQKKLDRTFVRQLAIEIVENMPQHLQPEIQQLLKL